MHKVLIFLHVPKCGGTTINRALRLKMFSPLEVIKEIFIPRFSSGDYLVKCIEDAKKSTLWRRLTGWSLFKARHIPYGIHTRLSNDYEYITVLRNPINWVYSAYHFSKTSKSDDISLQEFITNGRNSPKYYHKYTDNIMTRMICSDDGVAKKIPIGQCNEKMLETAIERINSSFLSVLILERLDESLLCLKKKMKWNLFFYVTSNVNKKKPSFNKNSDDEELIKKFNLLDIQLYKHANHLLDIEIERYGNDFASDLAKFRKRNYFLSKLFNPINNVFSSFRKKQEINN